MQELKRMQEQLAEMEAEKNAVGIELEGMDARGRFVASYDGLACEEGIAAVSRASSERRLAYLLAQPVFLPMCFASCEQRSQVASASHTSPRAED
jgi:hypothetical protein